MVVWAAEHCDCVHESAFRVLSVHTTKAGAWRAVRSHKLATWAEDSQSSHCWDWWRHKAWCVTGYEVQEKT